MDFKPVIIMNGSGWVQCGFSDEKTPRAVFPNLFGGPKHPGIMVGMGKDEFLGDEALSKRGILHLKNIIPIDGSPMNFNYLEKIWHHSFYNELRIIPEVQKVFMTDLPEMDEKAYSTMMEILFEYFDVNATYFSNPSVLASLVGGSTNGLVIDSGYGRTRLVPVIDSYPVIHASTKMENPIDKKIKPDLGGFVLTQYLSEILKERGYEMSQSSVERFICRGIKEKLCYVSTDFDQDMRNSETEPEKYEKLFEISTDEVYQYEMSSLVRHLPDGEKLMIGNQLFRTCEVLFNPKLVGRKILGVHEFIVHSIQKCDPDIRPEMYKNLILTGGNMMFPGLDVRIRSELMKITRNEIGFSRSVHEYYNDKKIEQVIDVPRKFRNWVGGSLLCSLSQFNDFEWITTRFYKDYGFSIIKRKCQRSFQFGESELFRSYFEHKNDGDLKERIEYVLSVEENEKSINMIRIVTDDISIFVPSKIFLVGQ